MVAGHPSRRGDLVDGDDDDRGVRRAGGDGQQRPVRRRRDHGRTRARANPSITAVIDWLEEQGIGTESINYRLRDWLISPPALLGARRSRSSTRQDGAIEIGARRRPARAAAGGRRCSTGRSPLATHRRFLETRRLRGPPRPARDRHDGHLHVLVVVLVSLSVSALRRRRRSTPRRPPTGCRSTSIPAAPNTPSCTCSTPASSSKAMRDMGMFDDTAAIMKEHGRDPEPCLRRAVPDAAQPGAGARRGARSATVWSSTGSRRRAARRAPPRSSSTRRARRATAWWSASSMRRTESDSPGGHRRGQRRPSRCPADAIGRHPVHPRGQRRQPAPPPSRGRSGCRSRRATSSTPTTWCPQYGADTVRTYLMFAFEWAEGRAVEQSRHHRLAAVHRGRLEAGDRRLPPTSRSTIRRPPASSTSCPSDDHEGRRRLTRRQVQHRGRHADDPAQRDAGCVAPGFGVGRGLDRRRSTRCSCCWHRSPRTSPRSCGAVAAKRIDPLRALAGGRSRKATEEVVRWSSRSMGRSATASRLAVAITEEAAVAAALASERVMAYLAGGVPRQVIARPPKSSTSWCDDGAARATTARLNAGEALLAAGIDPPRFAGRFPRSSRMRPTSGGRRMVRADVVEGHHRRHPAVGHLHGRDRRSSDFGWSRNRRPLGSSWCTNWSTSTSTGGSARCATYAGIAATTSPGDRTAGPTGTHTASDARGGGQRRRHRRWQRPRTGPTMRPERT